MKKICMFFCVILMISFSFGGCGTPVKNSSGDSLDGDASKQEESSAPQESSKTESNLKAESSSKGEVSSKTEESSKAEESSVPEESSAQEESSQATDSSTTEESTPSEDAAWASAYLEIVEELQAEYGEGQKFTLYGEECFIGLVVVRLIDFDQDGQPELFCSLAPSDGSIPIQMVYGYNGEIVLLFNKPAGMRGGSNPSSHVWQTKDNAIYLVQYDSYLEYYWELQNGEFSVVHELNVENHSYDGEQMEAADFQALREEFETDSLVSVFYTAPSVKDDSKTLADYKDTIEHLRELVG